VSPQSFPKIKEIPHNLMGENGGHKKLPGEQSLPEVFLPFVFLNRHHNQSSKT
jgi:hypothetical protein